MLRCLNSQPILMDSCRNWNRDDFSGGYRQESYGNSELTRDLRIVKLALKKDS